MNAPSPLDPEHVDLLLSAELDGELEAAARDLGLDPADARARLDATPGIEERRRAFAVALDVSRAPEELPEAVRDRVVALALTEAVSPAPDPVGDEFTARRTGRRPGDRFSTRLVAAGAVAATLLLVVGVVAALGGGSDDDGGDLATADAEIESYGDLSDEGRLRSLLLDDDFGDDGGAEPNEDTVGAESGGSDEPQASPPPAAFDSNSRALVADCTVDLSEQLADGAPALARGTARFEGAPAGVVVFEIDGRRFAVVFDPSTCAPLKSVLGPP